MLEFGSVFKLEGLGMCSQGFEWCEGPFQPVVTNILKMILSFFFVAKT